MNKDIYPYTIPRDGLQGEWLLDGNADDTSGNGNNGSCTDITWVASERGYTKEVASFNGSSSNIKSNNTTTDTAFTINTIINSNHLPTTTNWDTDYHNILNVNNSDTTNYSYGFRTKGNKLEFFLSTNKGALADSIISNGILLENIYYNVSCDFNYSTKEAKIYINGVLDNTKILDTTNWNLPNHIIQIGGRGDGKATFNGNIGLVRLYNKVLSEKEIRNLYLEGLRKLGPGIMQQNNGNFSKYTPPFLPKPILHLNGNNDGTTFFSQTGSNHGTQSGGVVVNQVGLNKEMVFDGSDDYIDIPANLFDGKDNIGIYFKGNIDGDTGNTQYIFQRSKVGVTDDFVIGYNHTDKKFFCKVKDTTINGQNDSVIFNKNYLIYLYYNGNDFKFYVDNELIGTQSKTGGLYTGVDATRIGNNNNVNNGFKGKIYDFNIIEQELTPQQIQALHYANYIS